jgi:hypothetical protein
MASLSKYRDKKKDPLLYAEMLEIHNKYTTPTRSKDLDYFLPPKPCSMSLDSVRSVPA